MPAPLAIAAAFALEAAKSGSRPNPNTFQPPAFRGLPDRRDEESRRRFPQFQPPQPGQLPGLPGDIIQNMFRKKPASFSPEQISAVLGSP